MTIVGFRRLLRFSLGVLGLVAAILPSSAHPRDSNLYDGLRSLALQLTPGEIGISPETFPHQVWGVVMESGDALGVYSLVAMGDGTVSVYFSNGSGVIGGGGHESVGAASTIFLSAADEFLPHTLSAVETPLPLEGEVQFYFLTFGGIRSYLAPERNLEARGDPLSPLYYKGHDVITEIRLIEQAKRP